MAQLGRTALIQEVSGQLTGEFAQCLALELAAATPEEAAAVSTGDGKGLRIFFAGLIGWLKSVFRRKANDDELE